MKHTLALALLVISFAACKKEVTEFTDTPVIQAYIVPGDTFSVKITRQVPFSGNVTYSGDDINNLDLTVSSSGADYHLQPAGDSTYISTHIPIKAGAQYSLSFSFNKKKVSAYTFVPAAPVSFSASVSEISLQKLDSGARPTVAPPAPILLSWANNDASYYLVLVENIETTLVPIRSFGSGTAPANRFRKQPQTGSGEELQSREFQYFGKHRVILYHVLPDYASLYNQSTTTSQNLTNPSTSIVNGYGIFTALNTDTLYIDVKQL